MANKILGTTEIEKYMELICSDFYQPRVLCNPFEMIIKNMNYKLTENLIKHTTEKKIL